MKHVSQETCRNVGTFKQTTQTRRWQRKNTVKPEVNFFLFWVQICALSWHSGERLNYLCQRRLCRSLNITHLFCLTVLYNALPVSIRVHHKYSKYESALKKFVYLKKFYNSREYFEFMDLNWLLVNMLLVKLLTDCKHAHCRRRNYMMVMLCKRNKV